ncbi:MAG: aminopeptidase P N-terminal domain-containing protein, partial [Candidatus Accumulibacter sp.]|nr:aminopeptidase P N-terminal domain-containing protein [Accumulibacter sp.]
MTHQPYSRRRQRVLERLGDGVAVLATAPERLRNRDSHYPYRFDSYFWYLSGFPEPDAAIVLVGGQQPRSLLFCREKNEERETWDGFRYGPEAAAAAFGFDEAYPIASLDQKLPELIANRRALWHSLGHDTAWDQRIAAALNSVRGQSRGGTRTPGEIHDLRSLLDEMRLIKDAHEIDNMRRAADIASAG